MPTDLLLPAFALTLVANAVLIALAIRGLRRGKTDSAPTRDWFTPAATARPTAGTPEPPEQLAEPGAPTPPLTPAATLDTALAVEPGAIAITGQPDVETAADPAVATPARARASRPRRSPRTAAPASSPSPAAAPATRRSRRKFSLPPLDDDHEKVNRSIKTFLAGADGATEPREKPGPATGAAARVPASSGTRPRAGSPATSDVVPTTIAIMTIFGIDDAGAVLDEFDGDGTAIDTVAMLERALRHGNATDALAVIEQAMADGAATDALEMLERALRGAARGGDEVHGPERGRFRIVLPATGELAARAYVRRIRALIEPQLDGAERPMRLVVATATALNVPVRTATATAMRRLDAALAAHAEGATAATPIDGAGGDADADADGVFTPRTAGD